MMKNTKGNQMYRRVVRRALQTLVFCLLLLGIVYVLPLPERLHTSFKYGTLFS